VRASNAKKLAFFTVEQVDTANAGSQPEGSLSPNDRQSAAAMLFKEIGEFFSRLDMAAKMSVVLYRFY
jgi:hypothetical protein